VTVLEGRGLTRRFGGLVAVHQVDIQVRQGEVLGLFGPNGAGKTTLFNLLAGAIPPSEGQVYLEGREVTHLPAYRRAQLGLARTFQIVQPFRSLTALENVLVALARDSFRRLLPLGRLATPERQAKALALLEQVGIADFAHRNVSQVPLGVLKRLEVARALALEPKVLLLDEPLAGLTFKEAEEVLGVVTALRGRIAVVLVEHHVHLALPVCDRALVLDRGTVIAQGGPDAVRSDPRVIQVYLGEEDAPA
jgi:branched-chain amino acid transport system ATP-binding protein